MVFESPGAILGYIYRYTSTIFQDFGHSSTGLLSSMNRTEVHRRDRDGRAVGAHRDVRDERLYESSRAVNVVDGLPRAPSLIRTGLSKSGINGSEK